MALEMPLPSASGRLLGVGPHYTGIHAGGGPCTPIRRPTATGRQRKAGRELPITARTVKQSQMTMVEYFPASPAIPQIYCRRHELVAFGRIPACIVSKSQQVVLFIR